MVRFLSGKLSGTPPKRRGQTDAQKVAQAELDLAREAGAARRLDTRRKVIIGGALMALAKRDKDAARILAHLKASLPRSADRKLFDEG